VPRKGRGGNRKWRTRDGLTAQEGEGEGGLCGVFWEERRYWSSSKGGKKSVVPVGEQITKKTVMAIGVDELGQLGREVIKLSF